MRPFLATTILGLGLLVAAPAFAEPSADDRALARSLFEQGRNLMKEGNYAEACPKLEESQRLESGVGTLFNLGDCLEHTGRFASAWAAFAETADLARRAGHEDREMVARDRANALLPKLSKMRVHMDRPLPPMLELRFDDKPLSTAVLDTDMPVDPGEHRFHVTAPGKVPADVSIKIETGGPITAVELPALADTPATPVTPIGPTPEGPPAAGQESGSSWQKPVAIAAGAGAIVGLGIGAIFGLKASSSWSDAQKNCPDNKCNATGYQQWDDSRSSATVGTVGFVAGGVLAAAAILLFVTAPSSKSATPAAPPPAQAKASLWRMP